MSKTRSKQGSNEWGNFSTVSKTIVKQSIEEILGYCANGPMVVSLPMSKTRSNQERDWSNVSKTIEKQGIEGRSVYCANGPMVVSSPMYKTRSKIGSAGNFRDCSNVSKTIWKQGIKRTYPNTIKIKLIYQILAWFLNLVIGAKYDPIGTLK